jgi:hypothetical protein
MTTTLAPPSTDLAPAQRAVVGETMGLFDPEMFLTYEFYLPDSVRLYSAWTAGGGSLGDQADTAALVRGLDLADWLDVIMRPDEDRTYGRVQVRGYRLRTVSAGILAGQRGAPQLREGLIGALAEVFGRDPSASLPAWPGVGPRRSARR